jgi:hypothetical protein
MPFLVSEHADYLKCGGLRLQNNASCNSAVQLMSETPPAVCSCCLQVLRHCSNLAKLSLAACQLTAMGDEVQDLVGLRYGKSLVPRLSMDAHGG